MSKRRRPKWSEVAALARSTPGVWRLHTSLVCVDDNLLRHARRRVKHLRPTASGHYEYHRRNVGENELGLPVFDAWIRWVETPQGE